MFACCFPGGQRWPEPCDITAPTPCCWTPVTLEEFDSGSFCAHAHDKKPHTGHTGLQGAYKWH